MKLISLFAAVLFGCLGLVVLTEVNSPYTPCWCLPQGYNFFKKQRPPSEGSEFNSYKSYGSEVDWNNPQHFLALNYRQAEGKRIFYEQCVWCHADSTPAGPSNRSNVSPDPPLMNDGEILNKETDASLRTMIAVGGAASGKSAMMPPYGMSLTEDQIDDLVAYMRAIAVPEYHKPEDTPNWIWRKRK